MGYEIIYDRKFIEVGDKFIPLFQYGSSNGFEFGRGGREIPEKYWGVFNYRHKHKLLFTKEEIIEMAKEYEPNSFYKTRNTSFKEGEFERWYANGVNNAQTIEYYVGLGNHMHLIEYGPKDYREMHFIRTTEDLLKYTDQLEAKNLFGQAYQLDLKFDDRDLRLPKKRRGSGKQKEYTHYFILKSSDGYLIRKTKWGYKYSYYRDSYKVKKFKTEKEIENWFDKYPALKEVFSIQKIEETVML